MRPAQSPTDAIRFPQPGAGGAHVVLHYVSPAPAFWLFFLAVWIRARLLYRARFRRRAKPASMRSPIPNKASVAGSGVAVVDPVITEALSTKKSAPCDKS